MLFLLMLCIFVLFLSKPFATKTLQIQGLMQFGFYNPDKLHAFQNIKSVTPQFIMDGGVSPKVWTVCEVFNDFLDGWTVENVFLCHL